MLWFKISFVNFFFWTNFIIDVCIHFNVAQIFFLANQNDKKNVNFETLNFFQIYCSKQRLSCLSMYGPVYSK